MPETFPPENFNFAEYLFAGNARRPDKVAYIDDTQQLTYAELIGRAKSFATALADLGIQEEQRILLIMLDTVDLPVAFLGALYAGVVPVVVNTLLPAEDYRYMLGHSRARAVFVSEAVLSRIGAGAAPLSGGNRSLSVIVSDTADPGEGCQGFSGMLSRPANNRPARTHRDEIAFWLYSSGSTGRPKGTVHTHANLFWTAELYARQVLQLGENDTVFSAAKLFFAYGLGNSLTFPLSAGATTVLMAERPVPQAVFKRLLQQKPTVFFGAPTLYAAMLADPQLPPPSALNLRVCASAGESLPEQLGRRFSEHFGCDVLDGIGSTEMLHIYLSNRPGDVCYGTTGTPVPGYEVELRDTDNRPVADGEIGDLYVRGPSAALMYWHDRSKSRSTFLGEWVRTGDKFLRDGRGYYVYAGRGDAMLKISGQYVSPVEVEAALICHEAVLECALVGKTDPQGLVKSHAYVVLKNGYEADEALGRELQAFVKERLAPHKYPRVIHFVRELPKTATGKIQRFRLREG